MPDALRYPNAADILAARQAGVGLSDPYLSGKSATIFANPNSPIAVRPQSAVGMDTGSIVQAGRARAVTPKSTVIGKMPWEKLRDMYMAAHLAEKYSPLAAIGYDPQKMAIDIADQDKNLTLAGLTDPATGQMWVTMEYPSAMIHESIHNGIAKLKKEGLIPKSLANRLNLMDDESITRYIMAMQMGDPEKGSGDIADEQREGGLRFFGKGGDKKDIYGGVLNYGRPDPRFGMGADKDIQSRQKTYVDRKNALGELYKIAQTYLDNQRAARVDEKSAMAADMIKRARGK